MKHHLTGMLAVGLLFSMGTMASAQSSPVSDSLTVFDPTGAVFASVSVTEADENPNTIYFIDNAGPVLLVDPNQLGNATTLVEPDGTFSDIFGVASVNGGLFLAFSSDSETTPTPFGNQGSIFLPEGNGVFDATMYLNPDLQLEGFTAQFISDSEVPEPGSLALLVGSGLAGVGLLRRRRK